MEHQNKYIMGAIIIIIIVIVVIMGAMIMRKEYVRNVPVNIFEENSSVKYNKPLPAEACNANMHYKQDERDSKNFKNECGGISGTHVSLNCEFPPRTGQHCTACNNLPTPSTIKMNIGGENKDWPVLCAWRETKYDIESEWYKLHVILDTGVKCEARWGEAIDLGCRYL